MKTIVAIFIASFAICFVGFAIGYTKGMRDMLDEWRNNEKEK